MTLVSGTPDTLSWAAQTHHSQNLQQLSSNFVWCWHQTGSESVDSWVLAFLLMSVPTGIQTRPHSKCGLGSLELRRHSLLPGSCVTPGTICQVFQTSTLPVLSPSVDGFLAESSGFRRMNALIHVFPCLPSVKGVSRRSCLTIFCTCCKIKY